MLALGRPQHISRRALSTGLPRLEAGTLPIRTGGMRPGGLWTIEFGIGGNNGSPDTLYFADGINGETDGLFGAISRR